ncbi:MAG: peptide chain release factor N(5)-glutamine methyltransferase [Candidatus Omnitrophica bacterium]|nr:peptide chain release factor N(5)-glutamine methyltransferase [Candidatus Omnitrophota bacterium]
MTETELLFTEVLNCDRLSLYLNKEALLDKENSTFISCVLKRRISAEPIQYILGKAEFMGLEFKVTPDVLIPRPETEILVETGIKYVSGIGCQVSGKNILDIGTGSGCIAVSLAKLLPSAKVIATEISEKALELARCNAGLNNVAENIRFIKSDLFICNVLRTTRYDLIISNPPYIPSAVIDKLQPELQYEPRFALDGGKDGLDFYRRIIKDAPEYLKRGGLLILEIGFKQRKKIENIFKNSGKFEIIEVVKDYNNIDRVIVTRIM